MFIIIIIIIIIMENFNFLEIIYLKCWNETKLQGKKIQKIGGNQELLGWS
jgi:hypothetical protein